MSEQMPAASAPQLEQKPAASAPQPEPKVAAATLGAELIGTSAGKDEPEAEPKAADKALPDELDQVPEAPDYGLTFSSGIEVDTGLLQALQPVMHGVGVTRRQARALAAAFEAHVKATLDAQAQMHAQVIAKWAEQARRDTDYVDGFDAAVTLANRALDKLGTPDLHEVLKITGLNNHPAVLKFFFKVGKLLRDDGTPSAAGAVAEEPLERRLYGRTTPLTRV